MLSAPRTIAKTSAMILRPALAAPGRSPRRQTSSPASASIPGRSASVATSITPASETAHSSSNSTFTAFGPTGPSSCTMKAVFDEWGSHELFEQPTLNVAWDEGSRRFLSVFEQHRI